MSRHQHRRSLAALLVTIGIALTASRSWAEPSASDKETARQLVEQGDRLAEANDREGALKAYSGAHAIMNVPTTGVEVARAYDRLGKLVEARDAALSVTRLPMGPHEPEVFAEARRQADELANKLAARIPSLRVTVTGLPAGIDAAVEVDGAAMPAQTLGLPQRLNPGHHAIRATAPGFSSSTSEVTLGESESREISMSLTRTAEPMSAPGKSASPLTSEASPRANVSTLTYGAFGVGALGLVVGAVTGGLALSHASAAKQGCQGTICPTANEPDANAAKSLALVSDVSLLLGLVGAGVGVWSIVGAPARTTAGGVRVEPCVGLGTLGAHGSF